jgi:hypothetical protein
MPSASELEAKHRSVGLSVEDRGPLLECIRATSAPMELASLLYIWGYSFEEDAEVKALCIKYIDEPSPLLTSVCLKLVCDWWGHWREYEQELARYLDPDLFEGHDWYDEVIVAYSFVSRNPYGWSLATLEKFGRLEAQAGRIELDKFD